MREWIGPGYRMRRADARAWLASLGDASVDAIVTDPPYGQSLRLGTRGGINAIRGDGPAEARRLWRAWVPEAYRVARPDTLHIVCGTWRSPWIGSLLARHFRVVGCVAWDKQTIGLGHFLRPRWETLWLVAKGRPPRRSRSEPDVWACRRLARTEHPCQKPTDLLRRAVRLVSDPGQLVADPFAGIGSTGVSAIEEGRQFVGCEIDPTWAARAAQRLAVAARASAGDQAGDEAGDEAGASAG